MKNRGAELRADCRFPHWLMRKACMLNGSEKLSKVKKNVTLPRARRPHRPFLEVSQGM